LKSASTAASKESQRERHENSEFGHYEDEKRRNEWDVFCSDFLGIMERINSQEDLIKRYLLGELSEAEKVAFEDEYFSDRSNYDLICKSEDELLDAAARGSLSEADRERFERVYLTNPGRRRRVMFARALTRVVDEELAARSARPRPAGGERIESHDTGFSWRSRFALSLRDYRFATLMTAALLIGLAGAWFVIETSRLMARLAEAAREAETQRRRAETNARRIADLEAQYKQLAEERGRLQSQLLAAKEKAAPAPRSMSAPAIFALSIRAFRGAGGQEPGPLVIPRGAVEARLRINLPDHEFPGYQVMLLTPEGEEVFTTKGLKPRGARVGKVVIARVPAGKFASGDNILALSGINADGEVETLGKVIVKVRKR
jgi:hypothetical protein